MKTNSPLQWLTSREGIYYLLLALLLVVVLPLLLDPFRLNMVGKYLTYAFAAIGLVMCWGKAGILSLGQGVFFGLGGYCMAMFLKLEASTPEATKNQSTPGIPDFMDWNQITELPGFWQPFHSFSFTLIAVIAVPVLLAFIIGVAMFKRRVGGVYFAIITQAIAAILTILIIGQQGLTGGVNGITDLQTLMGWNIRTDMAKTTLYFVCVGLLFLSLLVARHVQNAKLGRILVAMRDQENRVRFSGYDVASFKVFVFCLAAGLAGIGGALFTLQVGFMSPSFVGIVPSILFTLQVGFMSPSFVGIVPSIEMVVFCALGGRYSLLGGVYGALLVNAAKSGFSESFPELWPYAMGALFIGVVLAFPNGLAGLYERYIMPLEKRLPVIGKYLDKDKPAPQAPPVVSDQLSAEKP